MKEEKRTKKSTNKPRATSNEDDNVKRTTRSDVYNDKETNDNSKNARYSSSSHSNSNSSSNKNNNSNPCRATARNPPEAATETTKKSRKRTKRARVGR